MSTETISLVRTESPGRGGHLDFITDPELSKYWSPLTHALMLEHCIQPSASVVVWVVLASLRSDL